MQFSVFLVQQSQTLLSSALCCYRFLGSRVQVCVTMALKKGDSVNNSYGTRDGHNY